MTFDVITCTVFFDSLDFVSAVDFYLLWVVGSPDFDDDIESTELSDDGSKKVVPLLGNLMDRLMPVSPSNVNHGGQISILFKATGLGMEPT